MPVDSGAASSLDGILEDDALSDTNEPVLWVPYFKPNLTISMVDMFEKQNANRLAPNMAEALKVTREDQYLPLVHLNDFWVLEVSLRLLRFIFSCLNITSHIFEKCQTEWLQLMNVSAGLQAAGIPAVVAGDTTRCVVSFTVILTFAV